MPKYTQAKDFNISLSAELNPGKLQQVPHSELVGKRADHQQYERVSKKRIQRISMAPTALLTALNAHIKLQTYVCMETLVPSKP